MCVLCVQEDGRELLNFTSDPSYVVDIDIDQSSLAVLLIIVFLSLFGSYSCCCCVYATCEVRMSCTPCNFTLSYHHFHMLT